LAEEARRRAAAGRAEVVKEAFSGGGLAEEAEEAKRQLRLLLQMLPLRLLSAT
jgi:hypothetical protein